MDSARANKQRRGKLEDIIAQSDNGKASIADQRQNIKIAFAEGYLAASPEAESNWMLKLGKVGMIQAICDIFNIRCSPYAQRMVI